MRVSDNLFMRTGIQLSYFNKDLNFEKLVFGNQIDIANGQVIGLSGETFQRGEAVGFMSASAGTLIYSNSFWIGTAVHHINEPNQRFVSGDSRLARKYSVHAGYKLNLGDGQRLRTVAYQFQERSITFAVNYKKQGGFNQLDAGMQFYFQPLVIGDW
jgi:type IX secretion system PorP/SprF family membrane protein